MDVLVQKLFQKLNHEVEWVTAASELKELSGLHGPSQIDTWYKESQAKTEANGPATEEPKVKPYRHKRESPAPELQEPDKDGWRQVWALWEDDERKTQVLKLDQHATSHAFRLTTWMNGEIDNITFDDQEDMEVSLGAGLMHWLSESGSIQ